MSTWEISLPLGCWYKLTQPPRTAVQQNRSVTDSRSLGPHNSISRVVSDRHAAVCNNDVSPAWNTETWRIQQGGEPQGMGSRGCLGHGPLGSEPQGACLLTVAAFSCERDNMSCLTDAKISFRKKYFLYVQGSRPKLATFSLGGGRQMTHPLLSARNSPRNSPSVPGVATSQGYREHRTRQQMQNGGNPRKRGLVFSVFKMTTRTWWSSCRRW